MSHSINKQGLPNHICQTYMLLTFCIGSYLVGAYIFANVLLSIVAIIVSFILLFFLIVTESSLVLILFAFTVGISSGPMLVEVNLIDQSIITEALGATLLVFIGLTAMAFTMPNDYPIFAICGFLYSSLSTMIWLGLLNIFFRNELFDMLLTYASIIVFTGYIIVDTHYMLNSPRSPVYHAGQLFLDFINMFVNLVKLLWHLKRKK